MAARVAISQLPGFFMRIRHPINQMSYLNKIQIPSFNVKLTPELYGFRIIIVTRNLVNLPEKQFRIKIFLNVEKFIRCRNRSKCG